MLGGRVDNGLSIVGFITILSACGAAPLPPPPEAKPAETSAPESNEPPPILKEPVATGKDCATAEAECGGGVCAITMKNGCDQPITCDLFVVASCQGATTMMEANARKRETFAAKSDGEMSGQAKCNEGQVLYTEVKELRCE